MFTTKGLLKHIKTLAEKKKTCRYNILKQYNILIRYDSNKVLYILKEKDQKEEECIEEDIPSSIKERLEYLRKVQSKAQKSDEWYKLRDTMITASDIAAALGRNKYEPVYKFILKKIQYLPKPDFNNKYCTHGNNFEPIARYLFEHKNIVKVEEFGLIPHKSIHFIGASPDGIFVKDGKLFLLEIKCPLSRVIKTSGVIYDNICPEYYWIQMQIQMEVCDIDLCYFLQCKFIVVQYEEYEQSTETKGVYVHDTIEDKNIYIEELNPNIEELEKKYPADRYEIIYWINPVYSCVEIKRDREWFETNLKELRTVWNYIVMLKRDAEKRNIFIKYYESLNEYNNEKIMGVLNYLYSTELTEKIKKQIMRVIKKNKRVYAIKN